MNHFLLSMDIISHLDVLIIESHDIGESLQVKLEKLEEVERAFVHIGMFLFFFMI